MRQSGLELLEASGTPHTISMAQQMHIHIDFYCYVCDVRYIDICKSCRQIGTGKDKHIHTQ